MNFNTKDRFEFIGDHAVYTIPMLLLYMTSGVFRQIGSCSFYTSLCILLAMVSAGCILGIALDLRWERNGESVCMNVMIGFGVYTVLTYWHYKRTLILIILLISSVIALVYSFNVMRRKIKKRKNYRKIMIRRFGKVGRMTKTSMSLGMFLILTVITWITMLGGGFTTSSEIAIDNREDLRQQAIADNMDMLVLLKEETWQTLSLKERLEVLRTVVDIERRYLGIPHELHVAEAQLSSGSTAHYIDADHKIEVNTDSLYDKPPMDLVDAVAHETYHCLQCRFIDAYDEISPEFKNLKVFQTVSVYKAEFNDYQKGEDDYMAYYRQYVERDARSYASVSSADYMHRINEYLGFCETADGKILSKEQKQAYQYIEASRMETGNSRYIDANGMMGYVDWKGNEIISSTFSYASGMYQGIALVCDTEGGVYYIDEEGKRMTDNFVDGYMFGPLSYAVVLTKDEKWALIDRDGEILFSGADKIEDYNEDCIAAVVDGHLVMLRVVTRPETTRCEVVKELYEFTDIERFYEGPIGVVVNASGKYGVIGRDGEILYPAEYESVRFENMSEDGLGTLGILRLRKADGSYEVRLSE